MFSIPHMIVIFVVVLIVFGPQKLPELARGLGKLMAEFRKASADFKNAFEQEMREMERQAAVAERQKQAAAAAAAAAAEPTPATLATPEGVETALVPAESSSDTRQTEAPVITPIAGSVPRGATDESEPALTPNEPESTAAAVAHESTSDSTEHDPSHGLQRPV